MDDEKPIDLRDKIAIEILNGLISNGKAGNETIYELLHYIEYDMSDDEENKRQRRYAAKKFEKVIRSCYRVADIMRKVRLATFE